MILGKYPLIPNAQPVERSELPQSRPSGNGWLNNSGNGWSIPDPQALWQCIGRSSVGVDKMAGMRAETLT